MPIARILKKDFPGIQYEMLLGDYGEVEQWLEEGRVDCGFLSLPAGAELDILPQMILQRMPYQIEIRPLEIPFYREIGIAVKKQKMRSPATAKFLEYLKYREKFC